MIKILNGLSRYELMLRERTNIFITGSVKTMGITLINFLQLKEKIEHLIGRGKLSKYTKEGYQNPRIITLIDKIETDNNGPKGSVAQLRLQL